MDRGSRFLAPVDLLFDDPGIRVRLRDFNLIGALGSHLAVSAGMGTIVLEHDWLPTGWVDTHDTLTGRIDSSDNVEGTDPGFVDAEAQDFHLAATSSCVGAAGVLASATQSNPVSFEYVEHQSGKTRDMDDDIGAFARE
jgi:hypothetical protein